MGAGGVEGALVVEGCFLVGVRGAGGGEEDVVVDEVADFAGEEREERGKGLGVGFGETGLREGDGDLALGFGFDCLNE